MESISMIKDLATAFGPSGFEDEVIKLARCFAPSGSELSEDNLRNLYVYPKNGMRPDLPTVLIDAHSDEVGLMVRSIRPDGTLAFTTLGDWAEVSLPSQKMAIRNRDGEIIVGVVSPEPPLFIDIGATSAAEVRDFFKITPACPIVPYTDFSYNAIHDVMMAKAFDCRLGCAAVLELLHEVKDLDLDVNVVAALSAQEEVGMRGAALVAKRVKPDVAICFEGSPADDTLTEIGPPQTRLKHGPMLRHMDEGMITHPRFIRFALDLAREYHIPVQEAVRTGSKTNGAAIHLANQGIPSIVIGLPVRYIHSHNGIASLADYKHSVHLALEVIKGLNADIINSF